MELLNHVAKFDDMSDQGRAVRHEALQTMVLLLNPITPHVCHALWQALGHAQTLLEDQPFPRADPAALVRDLVTLAVQVNGQRSEERRVGKEGVSTVRSRWSPYHSKQKKIENHTYHQEKKV